MKRYEQLLLLIDLIQPKTIIEVGTWNGQNAIRMIQRAQQYNSDISYIGYDLFETATAQTDAEEFNVKPHNKAEAVGNLIADKCRGAHVSLVRGNTRETLKPIRADLVFIDGGHSIETIASDYAAVKDSSVIVFDDYYVPDESGACSDTRIYGANQLVAKLPNVLVLPRRDPVKGGGYTQFVMVVKR